MTHGAIIKEKPKVVSGVVSRSHARGLDLGPPRNLDEVVYLLGFSSEWLSWMQLDAWAYREKVYDDAVYAVLNLVEECVHDLQGQVTDRGHKRLVNRIEDIRSVLTRVFGSDAHAKLIRKATRRFGGTNWQKGVAWVQQQSPLTEDCQRLKDDAGTAIHEFGGAAGGPFSLGQGMALYWHAIVKADSTKDQSGFLAKIADILDANKMASSVSERVRSARLNKEWPPRNVKHVNVAHVAIRHHLRQYGPLQRAMAKTASVSAADQKSGGAGKGRRSSRRSKAKRELVVFLLEHHYPEDGKPNWRRLTEDEIKEQLGWSQSKVSRTMTQAFGPDPTAKYKQLIANRALEGHLKNTDEWQQLHQDLEVPHHRPMHPTEKEEKHSINAD